MMIWLSYFWENERRISLFFGLVLSSSLTQFSVRLYFHGLCTQVKMKFVTKKSNQRKSIKIINFLFIFFFVLFCWKQQNDDRPKKKLINCHKESNKLMIMTMAMENTRRFQEIDSNVFFFVSNNSVDDYENNWRHL